MRDLQEKQITFHAIKQNGRNVDFEVRIDGKIYGEGSSLLETIKDFDNTYVERIFEEN